MLSKTSLPGLEEFIMTKAFEKDGYYQLHVELEQYTSLMSVTTNPPRIL
ncbi:hypothetical protein SAMN05421676_112100 [Salinibacillus kushneri]|uniref:Uncharacterized protein n=1 Tax=Salinibacillus kushneri TaxID=237682 RepID=A0A1I0II73_9BACI|nr:hypothetical protein [Salinibacillus kushneri]SET96702.1 hypothetical protein SAMN05421676_112100 [Salinibacillus kushneri]